MIEGYRLLEHTADMGIEARAGSCTKVMEEMAKGLTMMLFGDSPASESVVKKVLLNAEEPVELLVAWLNEIVYWSEQDNLVPGSLRVDALTTEGLRGTFSGEPFNPQRHHVERQVKAVTYHQACLEETSDGWHAKVYVDL
jgi:SHS2 domain-containing protein